MKKCLATFVLTVALISLSSCIRYADSSKPRHPVDPAVLSEFPQSSTVMIAQVMYTDGPCYVSSILVLPKDQLLTFSSELPSSWRLSYVDAAGHGAFQSTAGILIVGDHSHSAWLRPAKYPDSSSDDVYWRISNTFDLDPLARNKVMPWLRGSGYPPSVTDPESSVAWCKDYAPGLGKKDLRIADEFLNSIVFKASE